MKLYCIIALLLFSGVVETSAQVVSDCTVPPQLARAYSNDIKDLALYHLYQIKSPDTALIEIPQPPQDTILAAFAAIFNLGMQWEADSVFLNYCVHQWPDHPLMPGGIEVKVDTGYAWAREWYKGNRTSGYAELDQFLSLHHVYMAHYQIIPNTSEIFNNWATLLASVPINMKAFTDSLAKFPGVKYFNRISYYGDGDHIYYTKDSNVHLSFWTGWGDCPSGCIDAKNWKYTVSLKECKVWKDTILLYNDDPEKHYLRNCYLAPLSAAQLPAPAHAAFSLLPNPATETLYIHAQNIADFRYRIVGVAGQVLAEGTHRGEPIDLRMFPPGLYICQILDDRGYRSAMKFVKQ